MARFSPTERIGVSAIENIVVGELGWIFREQPIADVGIDAHIERVDDEPTGKLVALQIKTGESHFYDKPDHLVYYGELEHLNYWIGHALPVILVGHLPKTGETHWVQIAESSVTRTRTRWKIHIPKANRFGDGAKKALSKIFEGSESEQRMRKLLIDLPLMRHIEGGGKVSLELEDWINKSLGRTPVRVFIYDNAGNEALSQDWYVTYVGYGIKELSEVLFPWANAYVDKDYYDEHCDIYEGTSWKWSAAADEDNGMYNAWEPDEIYPYTEIGGEVEGYRLELTINELGKAFLIVADHLTDN